MFRVILILILTVTFIRADDLKLRDGTLYKDVKIVSHDATSVTILYADGGLTLPMAKLPDDFQKKLGYDPANPGNSTTPSPATNKAPDKTTNKTAADKAAVDKAAADKAALDKATADKMAAEKKIEWDNYSKVLDKYVAMNDKLVLREAVGVVTLNVKLNHAGEAKSSSGENLGRGSFVDIYQDGASVMSDQTKLKPIGGPVFLKNYIINPDQIVKVEVAKTGATESGDAYYVAIQPFSFDFWKKAGSPN